MWSKLSLRIRLTLLYAGLLALLLVILGVTFFIDTRNLLIENTASHIRARAKPIIEHWLYGGLPFEKSGGARASAPDPSYLLKVASALARDLTSRNTVAIVLDRQGKILASGKALPEEPDPPSPDSFYCKQALSGKNEVSYILSENGFDVLVLFIPLRTAPGSNQILGLVQLSSPLSEVEKILYRHGVTLALGTLITLILGSGLGLLVISSTLSELRHMIATCHSITEGNLNQRINLPRRADEVGQLAEAFNRMVDRLETAFSTQRRFVASAAHELRTPLTALRGSLEVLLRGAQDDPSSVSVLCQAMHKEVLRLSKLCEELLDLARLGASEDIHKQDIVLGEFLGEFIEQARVLARDHNVTLERGPFVTVKADSTLLKQIFFDLIQNATQHTEKNASISIGWKLGDGCVNLWVKDEGHGIHPEDLPHIFEPFFQGRKVSSCQEHHKGSGLGLALVKAMVEAHGGSIGVKSKLGVGTKFEFKLPL